MTQNSKRVFDFLVGNGAGMRFTTKEVQKALGFEQCATVLGAVSSLARKGYAVWDKEDREVNGEMKNVSVFYLTEAGANYVPED